MKIIQFREPGPPSVLECLDVPIPEPKAGEVLIRARAIGVGMPDVLLRAGTYSWMPPLPATPGTELSGIIEKVAPGVTSRRPGERVYACARAAASRRALCAIHRRSRRRDLSAARPCRSRCGGGARQLSGRLSYLQRCAAAASRRKRPHPCRRGRHGQRAH